MFGIEDHYDKTIRRLTPQVVSQAVAKSKRGDRFAMSKAGIPRANAWDKAIYGFRSGILIKREARKAEEAQHVRRKGY